MVSDTNKSKRHQRSCNNNVLMKLIEPRSWQKRPTIESSMLPLTFLRYVTVPNTVILENPRTFER